MSRCAVQGSIDACNVWYIDRPGIIKTPFNSIYFLTTTYLTVKSGKDNVCTCAIPHGLAVPFVAVSHNTIRDWGRY